MMEFSTDVRQSFDLVTAGVSPSDAAYLRKWERLIDLEVI